MNCPSPGWYAAFASLCGLLLAPSLAAQELGARASGPAKGVVDVTLNRQHALQGQVVSAAGEPMRGMTLSILQGGQMLGQVQADGSGRFQFNLPRGGIYQVAVGDQLTSVRVWTAQAAPPGATPELILVHGDVLRAQGGKFPYTQVNPWLVAGVVAAAVAIPVVLSNHRSDRGDGS